MPVAPLNTTLSVPLEREFEGWITWLVAEYFESIGIDAKVWAVSPWNERTWPADEHLLVSGKILGLQLKQPQLAPLLSGQTEIDYGRLHWDLSTDPDQFKLVKRCPEIFYCLPTFVDRNWRKASLHHCLLWRPTRKMRATTIWYENPQLKTWNGHIDRHDSSFRWGAFIERLFQCEFGHRVTAGPADGYLNKLRLQMKQIGYPTPVATERALLDVNQMEREPLVLLNVEMEAIAR